MDDYGDHREREVLVDDLLRAGDTMVVAGPPKLGKTMVLIDLAINLAARVEEGADTRSWLGYRCVLDEFFEGDGRTVLFLNLENPADESRARFRSALAANGLTADDVKGTLHVLDLKNKEASWDLEELWNTVESYTRMRKIEYIDAVIVDPIYQLIDGDENSNRAMAQFLGELGEMASVYGAALVFSHHFTKAWRSAKDHADRIAGAGTLSRFPEAIVTLSPTKKGNRVELNVTARRHDCRDVAGRLYSIEGSRFVECEGDLDIDQDVDRLEVETRAAFDELAAAGSVRLQDLSDKLGKSRSTITERVRKYGFTVARGVVCRPVGG